MQREELVDYVDLLCDRYLLVLHLGHPLTRCETVELSALHELDLVG